MAKILDEYRASMRNPKTGVMFHNGDGACLDCPGTGGTVSVERIASNLYELGANDKIVQRILRLAKPHVTKERYIKAFDPAVVEAMQRMQATLDVLEKCPATVQQIN